jgi:hypothetical protein
MAKRGYGALLRAQLRIVYDQLRIIPASISIAAQVHYACCFLVRSDRPFTTHFSRAERAYAYDRYSALAPAFVGDCAYLNIGLFVWVTGAGLLALLPDWFWKKVGYWSKSQDWLRASVYFDGECGFCRASAQIIRAFFPREKLTLAAAQGFSEIEAEMARRNSWVVVDESRARHFAFDGVLALAQCHPFPDGSYLS